MLVSSYINVNGLRFFVFFFNIYNFSFDFAIEIVKEIETFKVTEMRIKLSNLINESKDN